MCKVSIGCIWFLTKFARQDPSACSPPVASSRRRLGDRVVWGLPSRNDAHPSLDANPIRKQVTSFGTFLSTLCHEFCHHLDCQRFGWRESWHTRGFYQRTAALYHHARGTPGETPFWCERPRALADRTGPEPIVERDFSKKRPRSDAQRDVPMWGCVKRGIHLLFCFRLATIRRQVVFHGQ